MPNPPVIEVDPAELPPEARYCKDPKFRALVDVAFDLVRCCPTQREAVRLAMAKWDRFGAVIEAKPTLTGDWVRVGIKIERRIDLAPPNLEEPR